MGVILFREDLDQNAAIANLNSIKVNLATYNTSMNDISDRFTTLRTDMENADTTLHAYADSVTQALADGAVTTNATAIALLNADSTTDGSVDKKIATAITSIVNGAPEAYDTLQELLDLINNEDAGLTGLIDQLNAKVDAVVGAASADWNTLEKIEVATKQIQTDLQTAIDTNDNGLVEAISLIPHYKYDSGLGITLGTADENKVTLSLIPVDDILGGKATVYSEDTDGNITIEGIYTIALSTADGATAKDYIVESTDDLSAYKAILEYFYNTKVNA